MKLFCLFLPLMKKHFFLCILCACTFLYMAYQLSFALTKQEKSYVCTNDSIVIKHQSALDSKLYKSFRNQKCVWNTTLTTDWVVIEPHFFVYSAFLDDTAAPAQIKTKYYVKLLATVLPSLSILKTSPIKLICILKYSDGTLKESSAYLKFLPEHHDMCYRSAYIFCEVPDGAHPTEVSLTKDKTKNKWLKLLSALRLEDPKNISHLSVCVRPLFGPFQSIVQLVEFVSYYESMGVRNFFFYKYSVTEEIANFLQSFESLKSVVVNVLPWTLPSIDGHLVHAEGQIVFIQDCLLRSRALSQYVMILDLDEFIMPQETFNLSQAIISLESDYPLAGNFLIPMVMFCEEFIPVWDSSILPLVTQIAKKRQETPWTHTYRSKFIARSFRINIGGIHEVWENVYPYISVNVPSSKLMIYHYRSCCNLLQPGFLGLGVFDFSPMDSDKIIEDLRMQHIQQKIMNSSTISFMKEILNQHIC